jgi:hypothetical protein
MAARSHIPCRGRYPGCRGQAHRGNIVDMCNPCLEEHKLRMAAEGRDVRGRQLKLSVQGAVEREVGPVFDLAGELLNAEYGIRAAATGLSAMEAGMIGLEGRSDEGFEEFVRDVAPILDAKERALKRLRDAPPATLVNDQVTHLSDQEREEIRQMIRNGAATAQEVAQDYQLTRRAVDEILNEVPEVPELEPTPRRPRGGVRTPEHLAAMRAAKAAKRDAELAELEHLRAVAQVGLTPSGSPRWKVTILQPTEVVVEAPTLSAAMAETRTLYAVGEDGILGIVRE